MTAEQLLERAGNGRAELVRGELVELMPVGFLHSRLVGRLLSWILMFVDKHNLGAAGTELGVILRRDPDVVLAPDISFISRSRVEHPTSTRFFDGPPDLAVEVLSPDDRAGKTQEKIREYLQAGTRQVWIVDADSSTVTVYLPSGAAQVYSGKDEVPGGDVLPGFSFRPAELFHFES